MSEIAEETFLLEVSDLKQAAYCPRVIYYRYCLPEIRPITDLMRAGQRNHNDESEREERRSLRSYGLAEGERFFDLYLRSERLGLRGRIDLAIAVPKRDSPQAEAIVVEYKDSERATASHFKLQVTAYALLLEEAWQLPVRRAMIYSIPERRAESVTITPSLRKKVLSLIAELHNSVQSERIPAAPSNRRPCIDCEFRRFCNDVI